MNIIDYIKATGQQSFDQVPLNELDLVCLNELGYVSYQELLTTAVDWQTFHPLTDLASAYGRPVDQLETSFLLTQKRLDLLEAVVTSPRFEGLEIGHYINDISDEYEKQFAALVWRLPSINHTQLVFRGTDDSLVGWKEDFKMTYMSTIPAQYSASRYLQDFLRAYPELDNLVVSGHSKGGNLALYASSHLPRELQTRLERILVLDAPGLHADLLQRQGYLAIRERIIGLRPQESIVGVMLSSDMDYQTIESSASGILQHDVASWLVDETAFHRLTELSDFSRNLEKTFADWVASYSNQELKRLVDTFFDLFFEGGIGSLDDLAENPGQTFVEVLTNLNDLDKEKKDLLGKSLFNLIGTYNRHSVEATLEKGQENLKSLLGKWQDRFDKQADAKEDHRTGFDNHFRRHRP